MTIELSLDRSLSVEESFEKSFGFIESLAQLSRGRYESKVSEVAGTEVAVSSYSNSQKIAVKYRTVPDRTMFMLCYAPMSFRCWSGVEIPPYSLAIHQPEKEYYAIVDGGWRNIEITVSNKLLEKHELLGVCQSLRRSQVESIVPLGRHVAQSVANRTLRFIETVRSLDPSAREMFDTYLHDYVITLLSALLERTKFSSDAPEINVQQRFWIVRRAIDFIEENLSESIGLSEIAKAVCQSPRVLQYAFREVMQLSPCQYQQMRRLSKVKNHLRFDPGLPFKRIARMYGFSHYGRFSQQYNRTFEETPSETTATS